VKEDLQLVSNNTGYIMFVLTGDMFGAPCQRQNENMFGLSGEFLRVNMFGLPEAKLCQT
jgi:hypothetical protein